MTSTYSKSILTGGGFQDNQGNPLSSGWLTFQLSHDGNVSTLGGPNGIQIAAGVITTFYLDVNGNLSSNTGLWTNDLLTPAGSYYTVRAYNSQGLEVWTSPQVFYIQPHAPSINLGTLTPNTP